MKRILLYLCYAIGIVVTGMVHALPPGSGVLYYVHNDPSGTPIALTDESANVVWTAEADPFGGAKVNEDPDGDGVAVEFNVRFPGQYYDKETGLHYNYHRHYDPKTGRYLQPDPLGHRAGTNSYAYVDGNPIKYTDPLGLLKLSLTFGGGLFFAESGGTAESGIGFDDKGNICFIVVNCDNRGTIGPGFASLGGAATIEKGSFCEGGDISNSGAGVLDLGLGGVGGFSVATDDAGNPVGGGKVFAGLGVALGIGSLDCEQRTFCTNPFK